MKGAVWATNMPPFCCSGQCNLLCLSLIHSPGKDKALPFKTSVHCPVPSTCR